MTQSQEPRALITIGDVYAVKRQMASMWIGRGPRVAELEARMAAWVRVKHACAFGSGTVALTVAMLNTKRPIVSLPDIEGCNALRIAAAAARMEVLQYSDTHVTVYPERGDSIEDFARHLPQWQETKLIGRFGVFSFGALKDVTGGIGGCLVSHDPIDAGDWRALSPLSDINAALILSQLDRYTGHTQLREVADGKTWESPQ